MAGTYVDKLNSFIARTIRPGTEPPGLAVKGVAISQSPGPAPDFEHTLAEVRRWTDIPVLGIPRLKGAEPWQQAPDLMKLAGF